MKTVNLKNGTMVLLSEEARKLFLTLSENGMFWEYISVIFEEKASGKIPKEIVSLTEEVSRLRNEISRLTVNGGVMAPLPGSSNFTGQESGPVKPEKPVDTVSVNITELKGKGSSMLAKMRSMRKGQ